MIENVRVGVRAWPMALGALAAITVAATMIAFAANVVLDSAVPSNHIATHESIQRWLRIAFLLIAIGAMRRPSRQPSRQWRWAVGVAFATLACAVAGELAGAVTRLGWIGDLTAGLGPTDSLERRVFRLGAMAAYAVPMLLLLAASEDRLDQQIDYRWLSEPITMLLLRYEALLFAIGATMLASQLMAAAFVHREFVWLSAVGADACVAGCIAATIRARRQDAHLALGGWLLVCIGMGVGLLMGIWSFGGPIPVPKLLGDYSALPRTILRHGHAVVLTLGIAVIAASAIRRSEKALP
jgi:hypothetical protein